MTPPTPASGARPSTRKRVLLLVTLVAVGWLIGAAGSTLTGNTLWYCAIPAAVAVGWLFVADPSRCEGPDRRTD
ncbi:MAG: hypothetical protein Q8M01_06940 [Rubrivivax sp.]|nr:hypothetical protein [Rubrivivax sp.]